MEEIIEKKYIIKSVIERSSIENERREEDDGERYDSVISTLHSKPLAVFQTALL